jgi:HK97 family phage portal protein
MSNLLRGWTNSRWGSWWNGLNRTIGLFIGTEQKLGHTFGSATTRGGTPIDDVTALKVAAVLACVRVIATGVASADRALYRRSWDAARNKYVFTRVHDHPLEKLLCEAPNEYQTGYEWVEWLVAQGMLRGNAYNALIRNTRRAVTEAIPLPCENVRVVLTEDQKRFFEVAVRGGNTITVPATRVLHVRNLSFDAQIGADVLTMAAETIGLARVLEDAHGEGGRRMSRQDGVLSSENVLDAKEAKVLRDAFAERFGPRGPGGVAVLDRSMKWLPMSFSARDQQLVEQREYAVRDVARSMGVLPALIGVADQATSYNSWEQMLLQHRAQGLVPWWKRIEEAVKRDIIGYDPANRDIYMRFDRNSSTDLAVKDLAEFLEKLVAAQIITRNEARDKLGHSPYLDGDGFADKLEAPAAEAPTGVPDENGRGNPQVRPDQAGPAER